MYLFADVQYDSGLSTRCFHPNPTFTEQLAVAVIFNYIVSLITLRLAQNKPLCDDLITRACVHFVLQKIIQTDNNSLFVPFLIIYSKLNLEEK